MRKEIVAKTIQKRINKEYHCDIQFEMPVNKVLGCWIINDTININQSNSPFISGSFDLHSWVGINHNTDSKVISKKEEFKIPVPDVDLEGIVIVSFTKKPYCESYEISENIVIYKIIFGYTLEWICDTKLYVEVSNDEIDNAVDVQVNENYIENL